MTKREHRYLMQRLFHAEKLEGVLLKYMKAVICGFGSIGKRHARILSGIGVDVLVFSRRAVKGVKSTDKFDQVLNFRPKIAVIATETSGHFDLLCALDEGLNGATIFVEKPLFPCYLEQDAITFRNEVRVLYNLRFNPVVRKFFEFCSVNSISSLFFRAGSYLPTWRPGQDYRTGHSSRKLDGGILRDYSHELDILIKTMNRKWRLCFSALSNDDFHMEVDDRAFLYLDGGDCTATCALDYSCRVPVRIYEASGEDCWIRVNLITGIISSTVGDNQATEDLSTQYDRDSVLKKMWQCALRADLEDFCTFDEGLEVVKLIDQCIAKKFDG